MAEEKGVVHAYNVDFLNVVFAASSLFLFLSVIWMVWDDYDRDWKNTQRRFADLQYQVTQAQYQQAGRAIDRTKLQQLNQQLAQAEKNIQANQKNVDELQAKLDEINIKLDRVTKDYQYAKANFDHDKYDFESSRAAGAGGAARKGERVAEEEKRLNDLDMQVQATTAERNAVQQELAPYSGQVAAIQKQLEDMHTEQTQLHEDVNTLAPSVKKDHVSNASLLDSR